MCNDNNYLVLMDTKEEVRNGYLISSQMKQVWQIQMKMVLQLLDVCKKHGLRIWADGGTLLGVVREKGYIPWDDDIDLLMMRTDYDKLVSVARKEFTDPFFFQCAYTENGYYRGHSQLRYNGTSAILFGDIFQNFHQGIFIDIFVYDDLPLQFDQSWKDRLAKADKLQSILSDANYLECALSNPWSFVRKALAKMQLRTKGGLNLFREYEDLFNGKCYPVNNATQMACPCFNRAIFRTATKEKLWYRDTVWLPFEDIELPAPIDYDKVLRQQYGDDYMTPRQAPSLHGGFAVLDTTTDYMGQIPILREERKMQIRKHRINKLKKILRIGR